MKIHLANYESGRLGGGWTFQDNFAKGYGNSSYEEADVYFIAGASMVNREDVTEAKSAGKKIVLRVDNIPRNSRNRGTAMTRMKDFADWANLVVYQSEFAKGLLHDYLRPKRTVVILNGCDQEIFNTEGRNQLIQRACLYARSSSDETKNWEMARSAFQALANPKSLTIVGKPLDPKLHEYNFDFFMGEQAEYLGEIHDRRNMAKIYKNHILLLYSFFNDACSNTLIEALCCGMNIKDCYGMLNTGGAPEIMEAFRKLGAGHFSLERMTKEYQEAFNEF